ncbi:MAG: ArnT family glycosyltransferase [Novosphingobium sp.]
MDSTPLRSPHPADRTLLGIATLTALLHAMVAARYDFFRDELYFIVAGQHPSFGYVDQPPLAPLLAAGLYALGDGNVWLLRLPVVLAAGALVWVTGRFAMLLGGNRTAVTVAALAAGIAPMLMGLTGTLNTSAFDPLAWTAIALLLVVALRGGSERALVAAGLVAGIDLQIKYALVFWAVSLAAGLLLTPERRLLKRRGFWLGLGLGALIALPSALWQAAHGFPFLELGAAAGGKNADVPLGAFLANQVVVMNPLLAPLWLAGLVAPFVVPRLKDLRFLAIACLAMLVIVRLIHGKDYYLAPCYPILFAIGAAALAPWFASTGRRIAGGVILAGALAVSALAAPLGLPILAPETLARYIAAIGFAPQRQEKNFAGTALPQHFADQLGWRDFARQVGASWNRIPADQRAHTAILMDNYGEAAALDIHAGQYALPPALSGHNHYYLWGLRGQNPVHVLTLADPGEDLRPYCARVTELGTTFSRFAMAYENGNRLVFCEGVRPSLAQLWPAQKGFR